MDCTVGINRGLLESMLPETRSVTQVENHCTEPD